MTKLLRESFVPVLTVLGLLFVLLLYVRYQVELEADAITVINIRPQVAEQTGGDPDDQELLTFGEVDPELDAIAKLIGEQNFQQANKQLQQLVSQRDDSRSWVTLGILQYKEKRYSDALSSLEKAAQRTPLFPGLYFYRALVYSHLEAFDKAEQDYRRLIAINPNHFEAHYNLGLLLMDQNNFLRAGETFQHAVTLAGGARKARAYYQLGRALLGQGDENKEAAERQFNLAIRHLPGFIEPRLELVKMEPDTDEGRKAAEEQLLTVSQLAQGNPPALFALAMHYSDNGDDEAAIQRYRELLQFDPEYSAARYNLGLLLMDKKHWEEAHSQFNWLIEREPQNAKAFFSRGRANYRMKNYDLAIADYRQAIDIQQGHYPEAYLNLGLVQTALKEFGTAEESYQMAIIQRDNYATAWYNLGLLHMRQKQTEDALASFAQAVKLNKNYATAWYNMGVLYGREERNEEAIKAYQEALRLRPKYINAHLNIAVRWNRIGQPQKAIAHYHDALAYDATYSNAWYNLALVYSQLEQYGDAVDALRQMLELEPDNVKALYRIGQTFMALERNQDAIDALQHAVDIEPDNTELRLALAQSLRAAGDSQQAQRELFKGLSLEPGNVSLRAELASLEK